MFTDVSIPIMLIAGRLRMFNLFYAEFLLVEHILHSDIQLPFFERVKQFKK